MSESACVSIVDPIDTASAEHGPAVVRPRTNFDLCQAACCGRNREGKKEIGIRTLSGTDCLFLNLLVAKQNLQEDIAPFGRCGELGTDLGFIAARRQGQVGSEKNAALFGSRRNNASH